MNILETLQKLFMESGFAGLFQNGGWQNAVMILIACLLLYLGIMTVVIFGIYGSGYNAADFVYMQF